VSRFATAPLSPGLATVRLGQVSLRFVRLIRLSTVAPLGFSTKRWNTRCWECNLAILRWKFIWPDVFLVYEVKCFISSDINQNKERFDPSVLASANRESACLFRVYLICKQKNTFLNACQTYFVFTKENSKDMFTEVVRFFDCTG